MTTQPYGFRVVGHRAGQRRLVTHAVAFAAHARCDPRSEPDRESYLSYFAFGPDFKEHFGRENSERAYNGPCAAPWLWWDVDWPNDLGRALDDARRLAATLLDRYRDFDEDDLLIFLSGAKGFHVGIPTVWQPDPSPKFNTTARLFALTIAESAGVAADPSVYSKTRLFRAPNSRHPKSGLYKRHLDYETLLHLSPEAIIDLARRPEPFDIPIGPAGCRQAADDWSEARRAVEAQAQRRAAPSDRSARLSGFARRFLRDGEMDSNQRAVSTFRIAAEFGEFHEAHGFNALVNALLEEPALDSGLTPREAKRQIACGLAHGRKGGKGT